MRIDPMHWAWLSLPAFVSSSIFQSQPLPNIDTLSLGELTFVGQYAGISLMQYLNQSSIFLPNSSSLVISYNNSFVNLGSTNAGGYISAICVLPTSTGNTDVYIGGNFSSFSGNPSGNIIKLSLGNGKTFNTLANGVDGPVSALFCDSGRERVYVGGSFLRPQSLENATLDYAGNGYIWNAVNATWGLFPFKGFDGSVLSIAQSSDNGSIYFGGGFSSVGNALVGNVTNSQSVNFASAQLSASNSASMTGLSNPQNIICSNGTDGPGNSWILQDQTQGNIQITLPFIIQPSLLRIRNTNYQGRGTRTFRVTFAPGGGILNLTYIDSNTGLLSHCAAFCPLSPDNTNYQDFNFVNVIGITSFSFEILDWYGQGGGLHDLEIYQSAVYVYANDIYNVAPCGQSDGRSSVTLTGNWTTASSDEVPGQFLETMFPASQLKNPPSSITYFPYIPKSGTYSVLLYTPGCNGPKTCNQRTTVDVIITHAPNLSSTVTLYQTNNDEKYDTIFTGIIQAPGKGFQPSVSVRISSNPASVSSDTVDFVAQAVQIVPHGTGSDLNGLYEWVVDNPSQNVTRFDAVAASLPIGTVVTSIAQASNGVFIGGNFGMVNGTSANAFEFANNISVPLALEGLNGQVNTIHVIAYTIYFGGRFNSTFSGNSSGLNGIARYDMQDGQWHALESGVNGPVTKILDSDVPDVILVSGTFTQIISTGRLVSGIAFYNTSSQMWMNKAPLITGQISAGQQVAYHNQNYSIFAGPITSVSSLSSNGASELKDRQTFQDYYLPDPKGAIFSTAFWKNGTVNATILTGGSLVNTDTEIFIANNGLYSSILGSLGNGAVYASMVVKNKLYVVGNITVNGMSGFVAFDLDKLSWVKIPSLSVSQGGLVVYDLKVSSDSTKLIIGGSFDRAGSTSCVSICEWDLINQQWQSLSGNLSGSVFSINVIGDKYVVGGNTSLDGLTSYINVYDASANSWKALPPLPGAPSSVAVNDNDLKSLFIAGHDTAAKPYVMHFNGTGYSDIASTYIADSSVIDQVQLLPLTDYSIENPTLGSNRVLLATGNLTFQDDQPYSGLIFDGNGWKPYLTTTTIAGLPGRVHGVFYKLPMSFHAFVSHLSVALVILISMAISLGLIFIMVFLGLSWALLKNRRSDKKRSASQLAFESQQKSKFLLAAINSSTIASRSPVDFDSTLSTKKTLVGLMAHEGKKKDISDDSRIVSPEMANADRKRTRYHRVITPTNPVEFVARHSFIAKENGELGFSQGDFVEVLDNSDNNWWLGRSGGKDGVFPVSYLL